MLADLLAAGRPRLVRIGLGAVALTAVCVLGDQLLRPSYEASFVILPPPALEPALLERLALPDLAQPDPPAARLALLRSDEVLASVASAVGAEPLTAALEPRSLLVAPWWADAPQANAGPASHALVEQLRSHLELQAATTPAGAIAVRLQGGEGTGTTAIAQALAGRYQELLLAQASTQRTEILTRLEARQTALRTRFEQLLQEVMRPRQAMSERQDSAAGLEVILATQAARFERLLALRRGDHRPAALAQLPASDPVASLAQPALADLSAAQRDDPVAGAAVLDRLLRSVGNRYLSLLERADQLAGVTPSAEQATARRAALAAGKDWQAAITQAGLLDHAAWQAVAPAVTPADLGASRVWTWPPLSASFLLLGFCLACSGLLHGLLPRRRQLAPTDDPYRNPHWPLPPVAEAPIPDSAPQLSRR